MDQTSSGLKVKKLGAQTHSTRSTDTEENSANRWVQGISNQLHSEESGSDLDNDLDVRAVPIDLIAIDPTNPRELDIEPVELKEHLGHIKLPDSAYGDDDEWIDEYEGHIKSIFGDTKKAQDCLNIALFAAALKSPKNILSPICTWREETTFYLFAGERRYLAHFFFGASHALTRVWHKKPTRLEMKILEWQENHERDDLSLSEKITNMRQILEEWRKANPDQKMTVRKFGRIVSISRTRAALWYKVASSENKELDNALKTGRISNIETANELAGLSNAKAKTYINRLMAGENVTKELIITETKKPAKGASKNGKVPTPTFKLNNKADIKPVVYIVEAVLEKIGNTELSNEIRISSLKKPKELSDALTKIVGYIENMKE